MPFDLLLKEIRLGEWEVSVCMVSGTKIRGHIKEVLEDRVMFIDSLGIIWELNVANIESIRY